MQLWQLIPKMMILLELMTTMKVEAITMIKKEHIQLKKMKMQLLYPIMDTEST